MRDTITADEAAKRLNITIRTLWRWRDAGRIAEAPRVGNSTMFYAADVDRLREDTLGIQHVDRLTVAEIYKRLKDAETWDEVRALERDIAATVCVQAEDQRPLEQSYDAACGMAATHPDERAREHWTEKARQYGAWLGLPTKDTDNAIARKRSSPYATYETARADLEKSPFDPAYEIAAAAK